MWNFVPVAHVNAFPGLLAPVETCDLRTIVVGADGFHTTVSWLAIPVVGVSWRCSDDR
jgi:hypothetical protein